MSRHGHDLWLGKETTMAHQTNESMNAAGRTTMASATALTLILSAAAEAGVAYVDDDSAGGLGTSWADACRSLQDAIAAADAPGSGITEIRVGAGVYRPDDGESQLMGDRQAAFRLRPGLVIRGGYAGVTSRDPGELDASKYATVLSGDLAGDDGPGFLNAFENSYHVVVAENTTADTALEGVIIKGGYANALFDDRDKGGGLLVKDGSLTLVRVKFEENYAASDGGAIFSTHASPAISESVFDRNVATLSGGAIFADQGEPSIESSIFSDNAAGAGGGAIATAYSGMGVMNTLFRGNNAAMGGAMWNQGTSEPELTNVTMSRNFAQLAGGIFNSFGSTLVTNSILYDNWDYSGFPEWSQIYGDAVVTYTCIEGGWFGAGGLGNIAQDPMLGDPYDSDFRPGHGSPAIDAGNNLAVPAWITTDLAGNDRIVDDPDVGDTGEPGDSPAARTPIVDMGAYESQGLTQAPKRRVAPARSTTQAGLGLDE
jgi:predicted outer membrane repeat protein